MKHLHVLLLCGGGGSEHEISLLSANYLESQLKELAEVSVTALNYSRITGRPTMAVPVI